MGSSNQPTSSPSTRVQPRIKLNEFLELDNAKKDLQVKQYLISCLKELSEFANDKDKLNEQFLDEILFNFELGNFEIDENSLSDDEKLKLRVLKAIFADDDLKSLLKLKTVNSGTDATSHKLRSPDEAEWYEGKAAALNTLLGISYDFGTSEMIVENFVDAPDNNSRYEILKKNHDLFLKGGGIMDIALNYQRSMGLLNKIGVEVDPRVFNFDLEKTQKGVEHRYVNGNFEVNHDAFKDIFSQLSTSVTTSLIAQPQAPTRSINVNKTPAKTPVQTVEDIRIVTVPEHLSADIATKLVAQAIDNKNTYLDLKEVKLIDLDAIGELKQYKGWIDLSGLESIDLETAKELGTLPNDLYLNGLNHVDANILEKLLNRNGLYLNGITSIDSKSAEVIAGSNIHYLFIENLILDSNNYEIVNILSQFKGKIFLNQELSQEDVNDLKGAMPMEYFEGEEKDGMKASIMLGKDKYGMAHFQKLVREADIQASVIPELNTVNFYKDGYRLPLFFSFEESKLKMRDLPDNKYLDVEREADLYYIYEHNPLRKYENMVKGKKTLSKEELNPLLPDNLKNVGLEMENGELVYVYPGGFGKDKYKLLTSGARGTLVKLNASYSSNHTMFLPAGKKFEKANFEIAHFMPTENFTNFLEQKQKISETNDLFKTYSRLIEQKLDLNTDQLKSYLPENLKDKGFYMTKGVLLRKGFPGRRYSLVTHGEEKGGVVATYETYLYYSKASDPELNFKTPVPYWVSKELIPYIVQGYIKLGND